MPERATLAVSIGAALLAAGAFVLARSRGRTAASFGVVPLGSSLAPALAIWPIHTPRWKDELPVAERWLYLPVAGAAVLLGPRSRGSPRARPLAGAAVVVAFAATTSSAPRCTAPRSRWRVRLVRVPRRGPGDPDPARALLRREDARPACARGGAARGGRAALREADALAPGLPDHLPRTLAQAELDLGRPDLAASALERLLNPAFASAPGFVRQRLDFGNDTIERFDRADAWHLLGRAYAAMGRNADADAAFANAAL